jgi:hypothetical protein
MYIETSKGKVPVRYGWNALAKFGDLTGKSMNDVLEMDLDKMSISDLLAFILVGLQEGARKEEEECKISSVEEVGDLVDEDPEIVNKVMEAFADMSKSTGEKVEGKKK